MAEGMLDPPASSGGGDKNTTHLGSVLGSSPPRAPVGVGDSKLPEPPPDLGEVQKLRRKFSGDVGTFPLFNGPFTIESQHLIHRTSPVNLSKARHVPANALALSRKRERGLRIDKPELISH